MYAQNDKENGVDFYNSVFPGEVKMYVCSFLAWKTRAWIIAGLTLKVTSWGTLYMVFIGLVFHYTIKTCLKKVWHCGYEWVEKMCRFAEDMS